MRTHLQTLRAHPRHLILAALVAGLLLGRAPAAAVLAATGIAAALGGRRLAAVLAAAAVLGGAATTHARLTALDAGVLASMDGRTIATRVVLLEPVRRRQVGPSVARVRLLDGPGRGEQAVLRARQWPREASTAAAAGGVGVGGTAAGGAGAAPDGLGAAAGGPGAAAGTAAGGVGAAAGGVGAGGTAAVGVGAGGAAAGGVGAAGTAAAEAGTAAGEAGAAAGAAGGAGTLAGGEEAAAGGKAATTGRRDGVPGGAGGDAADGSAGGRGVTSAQVGDILRVRGRVMPLGKADLYQRKRNAHAAISAYVVESTGQRRGGLNGWLDGVRRRAERGLDAGLKAPEAALLRGMVLGEDERLTEETKDDFQRSGLAHILAVSGSNVMLLAALILGLSALVGIPLRARLLLAAAVIALYVPLTGAGPSIQRAGIMGLAGLTAALAGRPSRRWYALLLAAALTLVLNPRAIEEPGWQLSFAAVAALLIGHGPLTRALERRMPKALAEATAMTVAATLGTAPLMAMHFQQVSLASLPANLLAAPAIAPIMWLGVGASTVGQISAHLALPFNALTGPMLVYVQQVAHVTGSTRASVIDLHGSPVLLLLVTSVVVAATAAGLRRWGRHALTSPRGFPRTWLVPPVIGVTLLVATRPSAAEPPDPGELVISFLDIGQGDATLIQLDDTNVLVDTGPPDGPILRRLKEARIGHLDALMLTHAESDHEGAADQVIGAYHPRIVIDGGAGWPSRIQRSLNALASNVHPPQAGETLTLGQLRFTVLWPPRRAPGWRPTGNPNDNALVTRLEADGISALLTADAESNVLTPLQIQPVDVLKVSHHGSADEGLPQLLQRLHPRFAAIEVGAHNTYGHPVPSTLEALRTVPTVVRTDRDGTVRLHTKDGRMWVER